MMKLWKIGTIVLNRPVLVLVPHSPLPFSFVPFSGYNEVEPIFLCQKAELEAMYSYIGTLEKKKLINRTPYASVFGLRIRT